MTECNQTFFPFEAHFSRQVVGRFAGDRLTTEGGSLLLRQAERKIGLLRRVAACFTDYRQPERIEHRLEEMLAQRIYGLALGYEDLNDHEQLRQDPLLGVLAGKKDLGEPLAGKSTLNRLELTPAGSPVAERYSKNQLFGRSTRHLLVDLFLEAYASAPREIVLDLDATDTPLHGRQEARFFHGYYGHYCYLPLYVFCGDHLLCARLRPSNIDASAGSLEELQRIVRQIRARWPKTRIILRADSGFCREELLAWCENSDVDYVFGFARNKRLRRIIGRAMREAKQQHRRTGIYLVTSLDAQDWPAQKLYEQLYCARGEMENRIKEPAEPVRRPAQYGDVTGQSVAAVLLLTGLCACRGLTATGLGGYGMGGSPGGYHSTEAIVGFTGTRATMPVRFRTMIRRLS
ncbi:MAG: IS1380 family transposase [Candidatus Acidiferrum sp.]